MELGISLLVHVVVAGTVGYAVDGWLGTLPWGMLGLGVLGFAAWLWQLWKGLQKPVDGGDGVR